MTKKPPDLAALTNELQGASLFFAPHSPVPKANMPSTVQETQAQTEQFAPRTVYQNTGAKNERSNVRTNGATVERKKNRVKIRHTFDIFADQLVALQTLQLAAVQNGRRKPALGKMVQQAIDLYLASKAKRGKKNRT
jgi:hypothetical protein